MMEQFGSTIILAITALLGFLVITLIRSSHDPEANAKKINELLVNDYETLEREYKANKLVLWITFSGGLALTASFAMTFFSGDTLNPSQWNTGQWIAVGVGMLVVFSITTVQASVYQDFNGGLPAIIVTILVLTFVFYSEIATTSEREQELVKSRSEQSSVMTSVLSAIKYSSTALPDSTDPELTNAIQKLGEHKGELARCDRHAKRGQARVDQCIQYERARIQRYQTIIDQHRQQQEAHKKQQGQKTEQLIKTAKSLEYNENNHSGFIKFIANTFYIAFLSAMMFTSFLLVSAFEAGFHYIGSRVGLLKRAMQIKKQQQQKQNQPPPNTQPIAAPAWSNPFVGQSFGVNTQQPAVAINAEQQTEIPYQKNDFGFIKTNQPKPNRNQTVTPDVTNQLHTRNRLVTPDVTNRLHQESAPRPTQRGQLHISDDAVTPATQSDQQKHSNVTTADAVTLKPQSVTQKMDVTKSEQPKPKSRTSRKSRNAISADTGTSGKNATRYNALKRAIRNGSITPTVRGIMKFKHGGVGIGNATAQKYLKQLKQENVI